MSKMRPLVNLADIAAIEVSSYVKSNLVQQSDSSCSRLCKKYIIFIYMQTNTLLHIHADKCTYLREEIRPYRESEKAEVLPMFGNSVREL